MNQPLAYVFWHWKRRDVGDAHYEAGQRAFHAALASEPPPGFRRSFSSGCSAAPWAAGGDPAYEDWYLVDDFAALGRLNEAAVTGSRADPHDGAAALAAGATAGVFGLKAGTLMAQPQFASWFSKPAGMSYLELFARLQPVIEDTHAALWMRQMTLGPTREFCLHSLTPVPVPAGLDPLVLSLRPILPFAG